jgi:low affinity Fe/Cu permease
MTSFAEGDKRSWLLVNGHPGIDTAFAKFASRVASWSGSPTAVITAILLIVMWAVTGPLFGFSDFWQLTINTGTTIVTFLMVFIIQNSQNRDSRAVQIKLDELIRATTHAHNSLLDLEELTEADLEKFRAHYCRLARHARKHDFNLSEAIAELEAEEKAMEMELKQTERAKRRKQTSSGDARKSAPKAAAQ